MLDISNELSAQTIQMKCQALFSQKKKKKKQTAVCLQFRIMLEWLTSTLGIRNIWKNIFLIFIKKKKKKKKKKKAKKKKNKIKHTINNMEKFLSKKKK